MVWSFKKKEDANVKKNYKVEVMQIKNNESTKYEKKRRRNRLYNK